MIALLFLLACKAATPSDAAFGIRPGDPLSKYADTATVASVQEHMYYIHPPNPSPMLVEYLVWIEPKAGACFINANSPVWNLYRRRDDVQVFLHYQAQIKEVLEAKYGPATFDGQNFLWGDFKHPVNDTIAQIKIVRPFDKKTGDYYLEVVYMFANFAQCVDNEKAVNQSAF